MHHAAVGQFAQLCAVHLFDVMHSVRCLRTWGTYLQVGQITINWRLIVGVTSSADVVNVDGVYRS